MEKQILKEKLEQILKKLSKEEAEKVLDSTYKVLTGTSSSSYNDVNAL